ncbi:TRAF-like family protein [Corchorus olitorius]|uniref:TRAF-like family protein n=1 Tax=Corchorus olitorius TaxID=93759 RepID=A0A1R3KPZ7_9ROSI|nr:TRAF-like family protein [Corchorus olitorius]
MKKSCNCKSSESEQDYFSPPVFNGPADGILRSTTQIGPAHFSVKLESYSKLYERIGEKYESGIFEQGGHKWRLCFYPKGNSKTGGDGHISLYLQLADTLTLASCGWEVLAKFEFFILDQHRGNYLNIKESGETRRCFQHTKTEWGLAKLLSLEIFNDVSNGYLVGDCCILGAEVYVTKNTGRMQECFSFIDEPIGNSYTWEIEKFSTLDKNYYESQPFIAQGNTWKLRIHPKGDRLQAKGGLSAFLHWVHDGGPLSDDKVYAEYKLSVKNQLGHNLQENTGKRWFSTSTNCWGWCEFISRDNLKDSSKGFVVEDRLILEAEIVLTSTTKRLP